MTRRIWKWINNYSRNLKTKNKNKLGFLGNHTNDLRFWGQTANVNVLGVLICKNSLYTQIHYTCLVASKNRKQ